MKYDETDLERVVAEELLRRREGGVEGDLVDPLVERGRVVGAEEELGAVGGPQPEHVLALGVVAGPFALRLVQVQRRRRPLALHKLLLVFEEAEQLAAQDCANGGNQKQNKKTL